MAKRMTQKAPENRDRRVRRNDPKELAMATYEKGDRVSTAFGLGTVVSKRMAPPSFAEVDVYSVRLDKRAAESATYEGSILRPAQILRKLPDTGAVRIVEKPDGTFRVLYFKAGAAQVVDVATYDLAEATAREIE